MKPFFKLSLLTILLYFVTVGITVPQVNEPVKTGIEKIAESPPGTVATCYAELSDNPAFVLEESRLISDYETTGATKPLALVMAPTASGVADYSAFLYTGSLFLPQEVYDQVNESPPV